jgi:hypothetical protein
MCKNRVPTERPEGVADEGFDYVRAAYDAMKKRLGAPRARRQPKPVDPEWGTL